MITVTMTNIQGRKPRPGRLPKRAGVSESITLVVLGTVDLPYRVLGDSIVESIGRRK